MSNNADPDQLASSEAIGSGSTLLTKAGYIRDQQDQGNDKQCRSTLFAKAGHILVQQDQG